MRDFRKIIIPEKFNQPDIQFIYAEVPINPYSPFAIIYYSICGLEQEWGLRLDLDKQVFLDILEDADHNEILQKIAKELCYFIGNEISQFGDK